MLMWQSCPRAETIVRQVVQHRAAQDRSVLPALIRLQFHDCFVRGCDGSVLIDSAGGNVAEKEADPNLTLRMLDVIDDVKAALETACPGVVSCADIIGLAARDAVAMAGRVRYQLPTGRRDGTVSSAAEVHLPSPSVSFADALSAFSNIGLDMVDLTTLLGRFTHHGVLPLHVRHGQALRLQENRHAGPDHGRRPADRQELASDGMARLIAAKFAVGPRKFRKQFARSMVKLASVHVLTGEQGEVRLNCRKKICRSISDIFPATKVAVSLSVKVVTRCTGCCLALKVVALCPSWVTDAAASHLRGGSGALSGADGWAAAPSRGASSAGLPRGQGIWRWGVGGTGPGAAGSASVRSLQRRGSGGVKAAACPCRLWAGRRLPGRGSFCPSLVQQQVPVGIQQQHGTTGAAPRPRKQKNKKNTPAVEF
ncbi:hypothetical protein QYE76_042838 [Lolium multiflorum]|uniref:peroxidase n=1 Tax=Lolium multiflorum TaxID=4521 RepID=A0AAD8WVA2_LOLMU|nr:hypothetical protein QYE76_042838 [Lolium multiflorum]